MRKCPNCDKTFDDSMRFCQTDGTPLVDFVESPAEDPLKTTIVRQEELASVIPAEDPFKSSAIDSVPKEDSGDLLQLPEEFDPMKTIVSREEPKPVFESPSSFDTPKIEDKPNDFTAPEPPRFSEPSLSPPNFGDMSAPQSFDAEKESEEPPPTAIYMPESKPFSQESSTPVSSSPFDTPKQSPFDAPIPSPFSDPPKPQTPVFKEPEPAFSSPQSSPFDQPSNSPFNQPASSPFDAPSPFGGGQMEQQNQGFNQPVQNSDWNPPAPPVSNWQDQGLGANTPFQPPASGVGQDQTMAIISLVCALAGFATCITAPVGLVLGYMARKKAQENPQQYGGEGLAMAGMIIGGILTLLFVLVILLYALIIFGAIASSF
jgi:hypothetical protein